MWIPSPSYLQIPSNTLHMSGWGLVWVQRWNFRIGLPGWESLPIGHPPPGSPGQVMSNHPLTWFHPRVPMNFQYSHTTWNRNLKFSGWNMCKLWSSGIWRIVRFKSCNADAVSSHMDLPERWVPLNPVVYQQNMAAMAINFKWQQLSLLTWQYLGGKPAKSWQLFHTPFSDA